MDRWRGGIMRVMGEGMDVEVGFKVEDVPGSIFIKQNDIADRGG